MSALTPAGDLVLLPGPRSWPTCRIAVWWWRSSKSVSIRQSTRWWYSSPSRTMPAPAGLLAVGAPDDRQHQGEPLVEDHRRPAVPRQCLPVTRTPRLVAEAEAVHIPHLAGGITFATEFDRARHPGVLLVVGFRKRVLRVYFDLRAVGVLRFAAIHRRHAVNVEPDPAGDRSGCRETPHEGWSSARVRRAPPPCRRS